MQRGHILGLAATLITLGCMASPSLVLGDHAADGAADPCIHNDLTAQAAQRLHAQGFTSKGHAPQQIAEAAWEGTTYWRTVYAERFEHPDGRVHYATCRGVLGPAHPLGKPIILPGNLIRVEPRTMGFFDEGRAQLRVTLQAFSLGGVDGWAQVATLRVQAPGVATVDTTGNLTQGRLHANVNQGQLDVHFDGRGVAFFARLGDETLGAPYFVSDVARHADKVLAQCAAFTVASDGVTFNLGPKLPHEFIDAWRVETSEGTRWQVLGRPLVPKGVAQAYRLVSFQARQAGPGAIDIQPASPDGPLEATLNRAALDELVSAVARRPASGR